jgi:Ca2+/Na+ antiporter
MCLKIKGVFVTEADVGIGTIVGSAVFNILFVIGICALFVDAVSILWSYLYEQYFPFLFVFF